MAVNETACKNREMALSIVKTFTEGMKAGTQKDALEAVAAWIGNNAFDFTQDTPEENQKRIEELLTEERDLMTTEQRKTKAAFYLEGIKA